MEKNVLIIGYLWPWCLKSEAGAARGQIFAKYLKEQGWNPIIITTPLKKGHPFTACEIVEIDHTNKLLSSYQYIKNINFSSSIQNNDDNIEMQSKPNSNQPKRYESTIKKIIKEIFFIPDSERGWGGKAFVAAEAIIKNKKIDAVISISPPHTAQIVAYKIKTYYNIPWIADFPHLWSYDPGYQYGFFRRCIDIRMEREIVSKSDAITTVSDPLKEILERMHSKKVYSIPHGFDPELYNNNEFKLDDFLSITYAGSLHQKFRNPSNFFLALRELIDERKIEPKAIKVQFFGDKPIWFDDEVGRYNLNSIVMHQGSLPQVRMIPILQKSQLLLFLMFTRPGVKGVISTKLFEYLAANRPILAVNGEPDVVTTILEDTTAGVWAQEVNSIKVALLKYYMEFNKQGYLISTTNMDYLKNYTYPETVKKYVKILSDIT